MSTFKELVYMVIDELKITSDDSLFTEDHIIFLLSKYRSFILKQRYSDIKKSMPESNYQTICFDLIEVPAISGEPCEGGYYLRSKIKIPFISSLGISRVYPIDYYQGEISFISRDRMRYVGYNKYLGNIIYCSLGPDNYLYFKSTNPQFSYLEKVRFTAIFQDAVEASGLQCPNSTGETVCDLIDREFPIESALVPPLLELVIKELSGAIYRPEDNDNNAKDELAEVTTKK